MSTSAIPTSHPTRERVRAIRRRASAAFAAIATGLIIWVIAVPVLGVELTARSTGSEFVVGAPSVAAAGLVASLAGWGLLAALERSTARARPIWTAVALTALMLSLAGPLVQATSAAAAITLVTMHVAVGAIVVLLLRRTARPAPLLVGENEQIRGAEDSDLRLAGRGGS